MHDSIRLLIATAFLLPGAAAMAGLETGLAAYMEGDYETSLAECQPLAEEGNADAQFCVGRLYANGFGVDMNDELALKWYGAAAAQGHCEAQYNLGLMHSNGWGVPMNDEEAAKWYALAAEQGHTQAQSSLAVLYQNGRGVEQDFVAAYTQFYIAAELGYKNAEYDRDEMATKLSPEELAKAQQVATVWLTEHPEVYVAAY
jgi:TPR repeat protein